jgi:hypothetical protein
VTEGILEMLGERELRGVLAHEIAHIKNRDILVSTIAAAIASGITWIAHGLGFAGIVGSAGGDDEEGQRPLALLAFAIVAPLAATLVQLGISRSREFPSSSRSGDSWRPGTRGASPAAERLLMTLGAHGRAHPRRARRHRTRRPPRFASAMVKGDDFKNGIHRGHRNREAPEICSGLCWHAPC